MLSIEGRELPKGVTNIYWYWNQEHALDNKEKHNKNNKKKNFHKKKKPSNYFQRLSLDEQTEFIYRKCVEEGKKVSYMEIRNNILKSKKFRYNR